MACCSWVDCLVSIRFDLDIGPKIEFISPPNAITEEGKAKLLHCAFPDCNPDCGYNFIFYFTMPDCTTAAAQSFSQTVAPPTTGNTVPELYGAAFYRQKHDPKVPRRYVQQVVVLLSHLPYYNVHELILRVVAPRFCQCCPLSPDTGKVPVSSVMSPVPESYFEVDQSYTPQHYTQEDVLRDAVAELAQWPSPHPQVRYSVTLLQQALVFLTPAHSLRQSIRATRSSCAAVRRAMSVDARVEFMEVARGNARYRGSSFGNDVLPLFSLLGEQLHHLTYVWELIIRHEPLFILSNTPCVASATAFSVASLILPIQFNGTLRSYFTVQNEDFSRLSRMGKALPFPTNEALIVAGTNPFLLRSFSGWPSLLVVMDRNAAHLVNGSIASPSTATAPSHDLAAASAGRPQQGGGSAGQLPKTVAHGPRMELLEELRSETPPLPVAAAHGFNGFPVTPSTTNGEHTCTSDSFVGSAAGSSFGGSSGLRSTSSATARLTAATVAGGSSLLRTGHGGEAVTTHPHPLVTVVPASAAGSGVTLSAMVQTPTSIRASTTAAADGGGGGGRLDGTPEFAAYTANPHAVYALESSSGEDDVEPASSPSSSSSSSSATASTALRQSGPPSHPPCSASRAAPAAHVPPAHDDGGAAHARSPSSLSAQTARSPKTLHQRVTSTASNGTTGGSTTASQAPLSASGRRIDSAAPHSSHAASASPPPPPSSSSPAAPAQASMPPPTGSSVTLFTADNYKTTVESVKAADYRKRGGGHQDTSRAVLQQRLHNYFDSSVHFLLNHAEQSKTLLRRLEMVSLLDADAQRTSVSLSLNQWQGSPTSVNSHHRVLSSGQSPPSFGPPEPNSAASRPDSATPPHVSRTATAQWYADPTSMERGVTSCSHFSVADDILRKFFTSLTTEFLTPVTAWYQRVTAPYTAFHLCDRALCDSLLSPASFLSDFSHRHRETAPLMWTQLHSYKTYKLIYERFANGCLFKAYVCQLLEEDLRRQLNTFSIEDWVVRVPSEAERIDLLINLLNTIQRELNETLDPDVLFVTTATSVMASMAVGLRDPHKEQFMLKIVDLQL